MDRQALVLRCREALSSLRSRFPLRRVVRAALLLIGLGTLAVVTEALLRARLGTPEERIPTALYTRPDLGPAVAIAALDGAAMELRVPVRLDQLPDHLIEAVLAIEDQRFHQHHGLDVRRIGGALVATGLIVYAVAPSGESRERVALLAAPSVAQRALTLQARGSF